MQQIVIAAAAVTLAAYKGLVALAKRMKINWDWGDQEQGSAHA